MFKGLSLQRFVLREQVHRLVARWIETIFEGTAISQLGEMLGVKSILFAHSL